MSIFENLISSASAPQWAHSLRTPESVIVLSPVCLICALFPSLTLKRVVFQVEAGEPNESGFQLPGTLLYHFSLLYLDNFSEKLEVDHRVLAVPAVCRLSFPSLQLCVVVVESLILFLYSPNWGHWYETYNRLVFMGKWFQLSNLKRALNNSHFLQSAYYQVEHLLAYLCKLMTIFLEPTEFCQAFCTRVVTNLEFTGTAWT